MRLSIVLRYTGLAILLNAGFMAVSAMISLFNDVDTGFYPLVLSALLTAMLGSFPLIFVPSDTNIQNKESYLIVVLAWLASSFVGMIPYMLWGGEFTLINSWFESTSGYTTTGSTVLMDVEALPNGLLFWRSCTHGIGGAGIIIFALAILPSAGRAKVSLSNVEISPLAKDNYKYRIDKIVKILLFVYVFLISTETICLGLAGMPWFDAVCTSISTVATGGFSTKNMSIAYYDSLAIEVIVMVYMIISGLHFGLLFATFANKKGGVLKSEVARYYLMSIVVGTLIITANLYLTNSYSFVESLRYASFQFISIITTTGFATVDTAAWPALSVLLLIFYTLHCACAGSTSGGIKADRVLILFKTFRSQTLKLQHPNAIIKPKLNSVSISDSLIHSVLIFISFYLMFLLVGTLILTAMNVDLITSFTAVATCLGNVGPGFGGVSSLGNFSGLPDGAKVVCSLAMILGRLELYGFIQFFLIKSWR